MGALLKDRPGTPRRPPQLVPTDTRKVATIRIDRVVHHHGLMGTEVAKLQSPHGPYCQSLKALGHARLGNACSKQRRIAQDRVKRRGSKIRDLNKGGRRWITPVDIEGKNLEPIDTSEPLTI